MPLSLLGKIVRLQLQRSTLSLGERPNRYYDPAALMVVDELTLTRQGALARLPEGNPLTGSGQVVLDVHHLHHPASLNKGGENDLSVNFTSHYDAMRGRFGNGDHLCNGQGGENILVEAAGKMELETVSRGLTVRMKTGALVELGRVSVAHPCQPFSKYVSRAAEPEAIKSAIRFLDGGLRGFYCALASDDAVTIAVGDEVLAVRP